MPLSQPMSRQHQAVFELGSVVGVELEYLSYDVEPVLADDRLGLCGEHQIGEWTHDSPAPAHATVGREGESLTNRPLCLTGQGDVDTVVPRMNERGGYVQHVEHRLNVLVRA